MNLLYRILSPNKLSIMVNLIRNLNPKSPLQQPNNQILIITFSNKDLHSLVIIPITEINVSNEDGVGEIDLYEEGHVGVYFLVVEGIVLGLVI